MRCSRAFVRQGIRRSPRWTRSGLRFCPYCSRGIDSHNNQVGRTAGLERRQRQGHAGEAANGTETRLLKAGDEVRGEQRSLWRSVYLDAPTVGAFAEECDVEADAALPPVIVGEAPHQDLLTVVDAALRREEARLSSPAQVIIQVLGDQQPARTQH